MFVKKKKSQVIRFSLLRKEPELTLCIGIELYRLQIIVMFSSCPESLDNFMTSEETEAGDVEVIGQDAQAAK